MGLGSFSGARWACQPSPRNGLKLEDSVCVCGPPPAQIMMRGPISVAEFMRHVGGAVLGMLPWLCVWTSAGLPVAAVSATPLITPFLAGPNPPVCWLLHLQARRVWGPG
jgi:hypothetical protein